MMRVFPIPRRQRGATSLLITLGLFLAMLLTAVFVNRNLLFEQRAAANQARSTVAFEAAEAGLAWALARLNDEAPVGADCRPSTAAAATSFRASFLRYQPTDASFASATWLDSSAVAHPLQAACLHDGAGWACHCPSTGDPTLDVPQASGSFPAFRLRFLASARPGSVRVLAIGCTGFTGACRVSAVGEADATARVEVTVALMPALRAAPADALTANGASLHAAAEASPAADTSAETQAASAGNRFFAAYHAVPKSIWRAQPTVTRVVCEGECTRTVAAAIGDDMRHPLLWTDGDMTLSGPVSIGSVERPVLIVVGGTLRLNGAVEVHGLLHAGELASSDAAMVHGAVMVEGHVNGSLSVVRDGAVLGLLMSRTGSFARVNGSWRDF